MVSSTAMEVEAVAMEGEGEVEEMVESPQSVPHLLRHLAGLSGIRLHLQPPAKSTARLNFKSFSMTVATLSFCIFVFEFSPQKEERKGG